jgi:hypothetical protein
MALPLSPLKSLQLGLRLGSVPARENNAQAFDDGPGLAVRRDMHRPAGGRIWPHRHRFRFLPAF